LKIGPFEFSHIERRTKLIFKDPVLDDRVPWSVPDSLFWPDRSIQAQYDSALAQIPPRFNHKCEVTDEEKSQLAKALYRFYAPAAWDIPNGWHLDVGIKRVIRSLHRTSATGHPFNTSAPTIGEWLDKFGEDALAQLVRARLDKFALTHKLDWDPDYLFIKTEGHKKAKVDSKNWRLIWGNSIVNQVLQHMVWLPSVSAEIEAGRRIPSAGAMGLVNGQTDQIVRALLSRDGTFDLFSADCSGFDITVNDHVISADASDRAALCGNPAEGDQHEFFWALYHQVYACTYQSSIIFGDGAVYKQTEPGIQRSGCFITYSLNSRHTVRLRALLSLRKFGNIDLKRDWLWSAGDDSLCKNPGFTFEFIKEHSEAYGQIVKHVHMGGLNDVDFCSHRFFFSPRYQHFVGVPLNMDKHKFNLKIKEKSQLKSLVPALASYRLAYAFADEAHRAGVVGYESVDDFWDTIDGLFQAHASEAEMRNYGKSREHMKRQWVSE